jgi:hypothetical protein
MGFWMIKYEAGCKVLFRFVKSLLRMVATPFCNGCDTRKAKSSFLRQDHVLAWKKWDSLNGMELFLKGMGWRVSSHRHCTSSS